MRNKQKNHGFGVVYRFEFVLDHKGKGRKIMGLVQSTYWNNYICKGEDRKIVGL